MLKDLVNEYKQVQKLQTDLGIQYEKAQVICVKVKNGVPINPDEIDDSLLPSQSRQNIILQ